MASFDTVDFSIRANKNVERKLIFRTLLKLSDAFPLHTYRYLGLGGPWFADFLLAHRWLGVTDLVTIERDQYGISRARFNRPYSCVRVEEGEASAVLNDIDLNEVPLLVWLDYESTLATSNALDDIEALCQEAPSGSMILVTVNSHVSQVQAQSADTKVGEIRSICESDVATPEEKLRAILDVVGKDRETRNQERFRRFSELFGDLVHHEITSEDMKGVDFPRPLASVILAHFQHALVETGRAETFIPLFNFSYKDSAPMITVGGAVVNEDDRKTLLASGVMDLEHVTGPAQFQIDLPPLTTKEKVTLDQLLPSDEELSPDYVEEETALLLRENQLQAYQAMYIDYPVFGEINP